MAPIINKIIADGKETQANIPNNISSPSSTNPSFIPIT